MSAEQTAPRPTMRQSIVQALASWRTTSVSLLSFASGLPLGLVWIAIPDWMRSIDVDIRIVGLFTLAQAPWTFKLIWAPLMDRYAPPLLGRRRGWTLIAQILLSVLILALAGVGGHPDTPWVVAALALAIAFASASQDIAIDAYAVEVLEKDEQGAVVGARIAAYRAAMYVAGGLSITLAGATSWPLTNALLAAIFLPMMIVTWKAPPPPEDSIKPKSLRDAVWKPFLEFLARHRALEILAFVFLYKIADNLADGLLRPFLFDMGYSSFDRGFSLATIGLVGIVGGTFIGGLWTNVIGLGNALWLFGFLQIFSNIGYVFVARAETNQLLMYGALSFEKFTTGLGTGAFSVLLLRMTHKRFSATQYALFSSLFSLPRIVSGPIAGFTVDAVGWEIFFWGTIVAGIPGLLMLQRFSPVGTREPEFTVEAPTSLERLSKAALTARGILGGLVGFAFAAAISALLSALKATRGDEGVFDYGAALGALLEPSGITGWLSLLGLLIFGCVIGLATAAVVAARHGAAQVFDET
ncbi:MAG: MFS transporter [Acidobacteriota bacterium]